MVLLRRIALAAFALLLAASAASAREAKTVVELNLRTGPNAKYDLIGVIPPNTVVYVSYCSRDYCRIDWNGYSGFGRASALQRTEFGPLTGWDARITGNEPDMVPIYPPYPYRSGHYPKADWYYDLPPYTAIDPTFYRRRFFMMAQERDRYRYIPHIFRGYSADYDIDYGGNVDISGVTPSMEDLLSDKPLPDTTGGQTPPPKP
jgi:hypothetical protein